MKLFGIVFVACLTILSAQVHAEGAEEICHRSAESSVKLKQAMQEDPGFFKFALDENSKYKGNREIKDMIRERIFYIYNRKDMPDEDIRRLSFINCIVKMR